MRNATTRSGSSPISKYSPPPATASCTSELRSSTERTTGGGRSAVGPERLGDHPAHRGADADDVHRDAAAAAPPAATSATLPLHAWPSEMTTNAFGLPLLPNSSSSFSTSRRPQRMPFLDVGVPGRRVLERERRLLAQVIDEEEQRVRILGEPHLRRRQLREERQRHAVALPAQRLGEHAQETDRAPPAVRLHVARRTSRPRRPAGSPGPRCPAARATRPPADAPAPRSAARWPRQRKEPEAEVAEQAEPLAHRHDAAAQEVRRRRGAAAHTRQPHSTSSSAGTSSSHK